MSENANESDVPRIAYNQVEAARALGWSEPTLRDKERQGLIRSTKIGKSRLYLVDDLKRLARTGNGNPPASEVA